MSTFASTTSVSVEKSRAEIETILRRYGAEQFVSGWSGSAAMIGFRCKGTSVADIGGWRSVLAVLSRADGANLLGELDDHGLEAVEEAVAGWRNTRWLP